MNDTGTNIQRIVKKLIEKHHLATEEYAVLIKYHKSAIYKKILRDEAIRLRRQIYGNTVFVRGLLEIGNICKNDCLYCGIRRSNYKCDRYRMSKCNIEECVDKGYELGFRSFVFQSGEDPYLTDKLMQDIIFSIKKKYPECALTLSLGERSKESYKLLHKAGAERYLLRHETANPQHYRLIHPSNMSFNNRKKCLHNLRQIGYQIGCGMMIGTPYQTSGILGQDLTFIEKLKPDMCGIGPFIPQKDTPFKYKPSGSAELTCFILSILRIIFPYILLPATTALQTVHPDGWKLGVLSAANVIMLNLSPMKLQKKYNLYNGKYSVRTNLKQQIEKLHSDMENIGYNICLGRGDVPQNGG